MGQSITQNQICSTTPSPTTLKLDLTVLLKFTVYRRDIATAIIKTQLKSTIYVKPPPEIYTDQTNNSHMLCKLNKCLQDYDLHQEIQPTKSNWCVCVCVQLHYFVCATHAVCWRLVDHWTRQRSSTIVEGLANSLRLQVRDRADENYCNIIEEKNYTIYEFGTRSLG
eukprot:3965463-Amphidinium_carterae.2